MADWVNAAAAIFAVLLSGIGIMLVLRKDKLSDTLRPVNNRLDHLDKCMDEFKEMLSKEQADRMAYRSRSEDDIKLILSQISGVQYNASQLYVTKAELRTSVVDLREQIGIAHRLDSLTDEVRQISR